MTISAYYSWAKCSILWPVKFMRNTLKKERISFCYHKILNHLIRMTKNHLTSIYSMKYYLELFVTKKETNLHQAVFICFALEAILHLYIVKTP